MTTLTPQYGPQTFCPAYINSNGSGITYPSSTAVGISSRFDSRSGQYVVLWSDISRVFEDVQYVLCGDTVVSPLVDDNFVVLAPPRIQLHAGTVLHAVMRRPTCLTDLQERSSKMTTARPATMQVTAVQTSVPAPRAPQDLSSVDDINEHPCRKLRNRAPAELINYDEFYTDIGGPINKARLVLNPHGIVGDNVDDIDYVISAHMDARPLISNAIIPEDLCDLGQQNQLPSLASLAFSDQLEHQKAAAIGYYEYTRRNKAASGTLILKAIVRLLTSPNVDVQKPALKAAFNMLESCENADLFVHLDGLAPLNHILESPCIKIALDTVGCINLIANDSKNIPAIVHLIDVTRLLRLAESSDQIMQRRTAEALRNYTLTADGCKAVVGSIAFPILSLLLSSPDTATRSCSIAAIKHIVEDKVQRVKLLQVAPRLIPALVGLLSSSDPSTQQRSAICLEYLTEDSTLGSEIIQVGGLASLVRTTMSDQDETVLAAVGCLFNLAANRVQHRAIIESPLVHRLGELLAQGTMPKIRIKAGETLKSLQELGDEVHELMFTGGVVRRICAEVLEAPMELQAIMTKILLQLTACVDFRPQLLEMGLLSVLISLSSSENKPIKNNSSEAIFNLTQHVKDFRPFMTVWEEPSGGLNGFLLWSLSRKDKTLQYLGLSILLELLRQKSSKELRRMVKNSPEIMLSRTHLRPLKNLNSKDGLHYALIASQVIRLLK